MEKLKEKPKPKEDNDELEPVRQKLKNLLSGLKINGTEAYSVVVADIQNSENDLNQAIQIWLKLSEIETATNDPKGKLLLALNNFKNEAEKAWTVLNKYKRDNQSLGYPEEMLKKLNEWDQQRKKKKEESPKTKSIKEAQTKAEFEVAKNNFKQSSEYKNNQQVYEQVYFPLAEKAVELKEKTDSSVEEKELSSLLVIIVEEYKDWKTQLTDLEDKFNKLKVFDKGGSKYSMIENFSATQQGCFWKTGK